MGIHVGLDGNGLEIRPGATEAFGPPTGFVDYLVSAQTNTLCKGQLLSLQQRASASRR